MILPPHEWDDDVSRRAIWRMFDLWSQCYEKKDHRQAKQWQDELRVLTEDAKRRHALRQLGLACLALRQLGRAYLCAEIPVSSDVITPPDEPSYITPLARYLQI